MPGKVFTFDVIIVGSGAAGLGMALSLPDYLDIAILSKLSMNEGSTYYAQGGISAVLDELDSIDAHKKDTLKLARAYAMKILLNWLCPKARRVSTGLSPIMCSSPPIKMFVHRISFI